MAPDAFRGHAGFEKRIVRQAEWIVRQAKRIEEASHSENLEELFGEARHPEPFSLQPELGQIVSAATTLGEIVEEIEKTIRLHDEALVEKAKAGEAYDQVYVYTARSFEAFCLLAGEDELAKRIRPSSRRSSPADADDSLGTDDSHQAAEAVTMAAKDVTVTTEDGVSSVGPRSDPSGSDLVVPPPHKVADLQPTPYLVDQLDVGGPCFGGADTLAAPLRSATRTRTASPRSSSRAPV